MPPVLLDAHLAGALLRALAQRGVDAVHVSTWEAGRWRTSDDESVLAAAASAARVLVSLDAATLPAIARQWAIEGLEHAGLLILSSRINQSDIGGQADSILTALETTPVDSWRNRIIYARRQSAL